MLKKLWRFLSSMKFAVALLLIIIAACIAGSLIVQGKDYAWYAQTYSERKAALILALHLDDVFHSVWFLTFTGFLCCNLLLCSLLHIPQILRRRKAERTADTIPGGSANVSLAGVKAPEKAFALLHMPEPRSCDADSGRMLYAEKGGIGRWGAWVCHLGILLLIVGFTLGQLTKKEYTVYGAAGQTRQIGDTDYLLTVDDFTVTTRDDGTPQKYDAGITVRNVDGSEPASAAIGVNRPASLFGMKFYQNSYGRAARVTVRVDGEVIQETPLCVGEFFTLQNLPNVAIFFNAFYPDYVMSAESGPGTASNQLRNPAYLFSLYADGNFAYMDVCLDGEAFVLRQTADDEHPTEILFSEPQYYTVIQVKTDHFIWLAFVGGIVVLLGLVLSFYVHPVKMWALEQPDGSWTVSAACRKGGVLFKERFEEALAGLSEDPS